MEIRTFFQKSFGFSDETIDQLDRSGYFNSVEIVDYKKKQLIIREGDNIDAVYFLIKGVVRWYFLDKDGNEHTDRLIYQFGDSSVPRWYYHDFPSQLDIQAITDVQMIRVSRLSFEYMMEHYPEMLRLSITMLTDSFF